MKIPRVVLLLAIGVSAFGPQDAHGQAPRSAAQFTRADSPLQLDGQLDELAWAQAKPVTDFFEVYPADVAAPAEKTEARFLFDDTYVYVGIRAYDRDPGAIRSTITRRDQVLTDQDYVELLLDPLRTRQSAFLFRTNAHGVQTDGQFNEEKGTRDYAPDFDFEVKAAQDADGWTAEFRIPFTSLRYTPRADDVWTFVIYRNRPRDRSVTLASAPIPRAANCALCFATELRGLALPPAREPLDVTPYVAFTHGDSFNKGQAGIDAKWTLRPDTAVDLTLAPDYSQLEADSLQFTANQPFAISVTEKRPFFLEGTDLLSTPLTAIYTRAFTDPDAGARITHRGQKSDYTALLLRDAGGGTVIEPGPISSSSAAQDFESTGFVGRRRMLLSTAAVGTLASARWNDDGSRNLVVGLDGTWAPSTSDRITAQFLWSQTQLPDRADLLPTWHGQDLQGAAGYVRWSHTEDAWNTTVLYKNLAHGFRAWNGFVTQVGISSITATGGLYFYPQNSFLTRVQPLLTFSSIDEVGGERVSKSISPGVSFEAARDTTVTISWSPDSQDVTPAGLRSYDTLSLSVLTTPVAWMPGLTLSISEGDALDYTSGDVGKGHTLQAIIPLKLFDRLELEASIGHQTLNAGRSSATPGRTLSERNVSIEAQWHFSNRFYTQAIHQQSRVKVNTGVAGEAGQNTEETFSSLLFSYQTNWQSRYFIGVRHSEDGTRETELFAKLSYAFSR